MNKIRAVLIMSIMVVALTGCGNKTQEVKKTEADKIEKTELNKDETEEEVEIKEENIDTEENKQGTLSNLDFTVEVTEITEYKNQYTVIGNTARKDGYCGEIHIHLKNDFGTTDEEVLKNVKAGNTYVISTVPLMTMSLPPQTTAVEIKEATQENIDNLWSLREEISNYEEFMLNYKDSNLVDVIVNGNMAYSTWTNEQILEYQEFIKSKGYSDDMVLDIESNVLTQEQRKDKIEEDKILHYSEEDTLEELNEETSEEVEIIDGGQ